MEQIIALWPLWLIITLIGMFAYINQVRKDMHEEMVRSLSSLQSNTQQALDMMNQNSSENNEFVAKTFNQRHSVYKFFIDGQIIALFKLIEAVRPGWKVIYPISKDVLDMTYWQLHHMWLDPEGVSVRKDHKKKRFMINVPPSNPIPQGYGQVSINAVMDAMNKRLATEAKENLLTEEQKKEAVEAATNPIYTMPIPTQHFED